MNLLLAVIINDDEALGRETMAPLSLVKTHLREERNCPLQDSPSLSYTLKYKRMLLFAHQGDGLGCLGLNH